MPSGQESTPPSTKSIGNPIVATELLTNGIIRIGEVNDGFYNDVVWPFIKLMKDKNVPHIRLVIESPGGRCSTGYQLISLIRNCEKPVIAEVVVAASMGFMITTQCHYRVAHPGALLVYHDPWTRVDGNMDQIDRQLTDLKRFSELGQQLVFERTRITAKKLEAHKAKDWHMSAAEALSLGVIDEIVSMNYKMSPGKLE